VVALVLVYQLRDDVKMIGLEESQRQQEKLAAREELGLAAEEIQDLDVDDEIADALLGGTATCGPTAQTRRCSTAK